MVRLYEARGVDRLSSCWNSFREANHLDFGNSDITDQGLISLPPMPGVLFLQLDGTAISDAAMPRIGEFRQLEWLDLRQTRVSSAGLAHLGRLAHLALLDLAGTQLDSSGLESLCALPNLGNLDLGGTAVDDGGLEAVGRLTNLQYLNLSHTQITDQGIHELRRLTELVDLDLSDTPVTGRSLSELRAMSQLQVLHYSPTSTAALGQLPALPSLEHLHLTGPGVSDLAMVHILRMRSLKKLSLERTRMSIVGMLLIELFRPGMLGDIEPMSLLPPLYLTVLAEAIDVAQAHFLRETKRRPNDATCVPSVDSA